MSRCRHRAILIDALLPQTWEGQCQLPVLLLVLYKAYPRAAENVCETTGQLGIVQNECLLKQNRAGLKPEGLDVQSAPSPRGGK